MLKVQTTSPIEINFNEVLKSIAHLETDELEQFTEQVMALRAQRRAPSLPQNESVLLQKINQSIPVAVRKRYAQLNEKLQEETITAEEHQELLTLIDQIELADAERIHNLIALAELRHVSVDALMDQLALRPPAYA